jgi:hypothetical protein
LEELRTVGKQPGQERGLWKVIALVERESAHLDVSESAAKRVRRTGDGLDRDGAREKPAPWARRGARQVTFDDVKHGGDTLILVNENRGFQPSEEAPRVSCGGLALIGVVKSHDAATAPGDLSNAGCRLAGRARPGEANDLGLIQALGEDSLNCAAMQHRDSKIV